MYDRAGLSTKCTLIKTGFKNLRTGTEAKSRPFVNALFPKYGQILEMLTCKALFHSLVLLMSLRIAATLATEPGSVAVTRNIRGGISNLKKL